MILVHENLGKNPNAPGRRRSMKTAMGMGLMAWLEIRFNALAQRIMSMHTSGMLHTAGVMGTSSTHNLALQIMLSVP